MSNIIDYISSLLIALPAVVIAIGLHEAAHAYAAYKMGDMTAKNLGRLTINPLSHLDPIGFICLFLFHFGWAKPVPINPNNFKNQKRGTVITALAGPLMNFFVAFVFCFIYMLCVAFVPSDTSLGLVCIEMVSQVIIVNISLGVFNFLPIPPLDGAKIFGGLLPKKYYFKVMEYENYIQIIILILLFTGVLGYIISPIVNLLLNIFIKIAYYIVEFFIALVSFIVLKLR